MTMNTVATANLVGITGIARRLVADGALDEAAARDAMDKASAAKVPLVTEVTPAKLLLPASAVVPLPPVVTLPRPEI